MCSYLWLKMGLSRWTFTIKHLFISTFLSHNVPYYHLLNHPVCMIFGRQKRVLHMTYRLVAFIMQHHYFISIILKSDVKYSLISENKPYIFMIHFDGSRLFCCFTLSLSPSLTATLFKHHCLFLSRYSKTSFSFHFFWATWKIRLFLHV